MAGSVGNDTVEEFLEHHGVKGMKWGVRKDQGHEGERSTNKKIARLDKKFDRSANQINLNIKLHNRAASLSNSKDVDRINNKPAYKNADFTNDSPLRQKYYKEHQDAYLANLKTAASEQGTNASGTKRYGIKINDVGDWEVSVDDIKHASGEKFKVKVSKDAMGHITSLKIVTDTLLQSAMSLDDFLEHFGVKGMKWGRRKSEGTSAVTKTLSGRPISKQGENYVDSKGTVLAKDAVRARVNQSLAKKAGVDVLPTKELQDLVTRMNLEQQYSRLNPKEISQGKAFLDDATRALARSGPSIAKALAEGNISDPAVYGKIAVDTIVAGLAEGTKKK